MTCFLLSFDEIIKEVPISWTYAIGVAVQIFRVPFILISYTDYSILNLLLQNAHIDTVAESRDDLCSSKLRTPAPPRSSSQVW